MTPAHKYCRVNGLENATNDITMDNAFRNVVTEKFPCIRQTVQTPLQNAFILTTHRYECTKGDHHCENHLYPDIPRNSEHRSIHVKFRMLQKVRFLLHMLVSSTREGGAIL